jgi:hypothetical protein
MKTHQNQVVSAVAIAQQIPAQLRFAQFAVKTQPRRHCLLSGLLAVGGVSDRGGPIPRNLSDDGVFVVGGQQQGSGLARAVVPGRSRVGHDRPSL